jgi:trehalose 6-phosphate phosphatase
MTDPHAAAPARLALFTDFDGTLVELAETPDAIEVPDDLLDDLRRTAMRVDSAFAVVSGRELADIDSRLAPAVLPVAGSHGAQRRGGDGRHHDIAGVYREATQRIADRLTIFASRHDDVLVEEKAGAVALHYRRAPDLRADCQRAILAAIEPEVEFRIVDGKMVFEARPAEVGKDAAVRAYMRELPFAGRIPIFIGDDATDEDAFLAVQDMGGLGIKVGEGPTAARARLPDVTSVRTFLRRIASGDLFEAIAQRSPA